jgi:hypothetical protein
LDGKGGYDGIRRRWGRYGEQELNSISYCYKERVHIALGLRSIDGSNGEFITLNPRQHKGNYESPQNSV